MRPESVSWERAAEVREAAQGWRRVGAIDEPTKQAIREAYPDPCPTPSVVWRVLTACMVTAIILCAFGAFSVGTGTNTAALEILCFLFAGASLVATELLEASPRGARRGAAGATSFWAILFLLAGFSLFLLETTRVRYDNATDMVLIASSLAWAVGSWRWGSPLFAALSAISLFLFLGRSPHGRALWVLIGAALAGLAARRLDEVSWAPSHRRAAAILVVAGILAAYAAVNVYSFDGHLLEDLGRFGAARVAPSPSLFVLSALATAVVPLAVLIWGVRSRWTFILDIGIVLLALSLVTLRHYVHLAPLWVVLTLAGTGLVVLALAVERMLRRAAGGEIAGFTADPLFADERRQQALQIVPVVAAFTAPAAVPEEKGFAGGGGRFGGAGAEEKF
jgi:MFS family permease